MTADTNAPAVARVSFREAKEESYRALRAAGYSWGTAQVAGRLAGVAQVFWETGIPAVTKDTHRWAAQRRPMRNKRDGDVVVLNPRGMSWAFSGPMATAVVVGNPRKVVWVRGKGVGAELVTAVWDMKTKVSQSVSWGYQTHSGWEGFHTTPAGELVKSHSVKPPSGQPSRGASWFMHVGDAGGGDLVMTTAERDRGLSDAYREGVRIDAHQWESLQRQARKFLVPE